MCFSNTCFKAIIFFLVSTAVQIFGDLVVLRHPPTDNGTKINLTCISENDDAALIWNYDTETTDLRNGQSISTDFRPKNPSSTIITECAIWDSTQCFTKWENISEWEVVDSATKPIGPVFDYRWEGFREFLFNEALANQDYEYVKKVKKSSGTAVFSARGLKDLQVYICEREKPSASSCFWIIIGGWEGKTSAIKFCSNGAEPHGSNMNGSCVDIVNRTHTAPGILDPYEWRTFRIEWNSLQETIKVFEDLDVEPFLDGTISPWHNVSHILVRSEISSLVKFHFYEYFRAERENRQLSTKEFEYYGNTFCVQLLVNLCSGCELEVRLTDEKNNDIAIRKIPENEHFMKNEPSTWKSVKLDMTMENVDPRFLRLLIRTILNGKKGGGRWAIDNFRFCKSGGRRESTISIYRAPSDLSARPVVKCQKLSYGKSSVVDSFSKERYHDTSQLREFLRGRKGCGSTCASFDQNWLICDKTGCTCDRGFTGSDCNRECTDGYHGYNCEKECGSCVSGSCNRTTGYCHTGGKVRRHLSPPPQEVFEEPTIVKITDTTVIIRHEVKLERDSKKSPIFCHVSSKEANQSFYTVYPTFIPPSTYEIEVKNLSFNTRYMVYSEYSTTSETKTSGETVFTTTCMGKPRFEVVPEEKFLTVITPQRDEKCGDNRNKYYSIEVRDVVTNEFKCEINTPSQFPHNCSNLTPYTEYEVTISGVGGLIFTARVRTLKPESRQLMNLRGINLGQGIVKLMWSNPQFNETNMKRFRISVRFLKSELLKKYLLHRSTEVLNCPVVRQTEIHSFTSNSELPKYPRVERTPVLNCSVIQQKENYSIDLHLLTSTVYEISVVAVNHTKFDSTESRTNITVEGSIAFEKDEEPQVTKMGTLLKVKVPPVRNATQNTKVTIIVKELLTYVQNESQSSLSFSNETECANTTYTEDKIESEYLIDITQNQGIASNCSLNFGKTYKIVAIINDSNLNVPVNVFTWSITLREERQNLIWLIVIPIIGICLLFIFAWHRKRRKVLRLMNQDMLPLSSTMTNAENSMAPDILQSRWSNRQPAPDVKYSLDSYPVKVEEFQEYAKEAMASGLLDLQYMMLSSHSTKNCNYGKLPENLPKNRYKNLIAYDGSRVILKKIPGDLYSDYINANYIKGYRKDRAYIATQGPKPNTIKDFWRMVWQEKVRVICMLANVVEGGNTQCEQYWPEIGTNVKYGDILISNISHQVFADYIFRTFRLECQKESREVTHLHYTGWPDHGIPIYTQSLVAYLKKLLATPTGKGPVVVHCTVGIGRTGTIILCDICLRQAVKERIFDIPAVTTRMREDRDNMVENAQQYLLAHMVIIESMISQQTQIPCTCEFPKKIKKLREQLPSDIERLKDTVWQDRALHSLDMKRHSTLDDVGEDILPELIPATPVESYFKRNSTYDSESNYIKALSVDGVQMKGQYLESHLPSRFTFPEYWRLIAEKNIELIIVLQRPSPEDPMSCEIMPSDSIVDPLPHIRVEIKTRVNDEENFTTDKLLMTDTSEEKPRYQYVTVITCNGWACGKGGKPPAVTTLVSLWRATERISRKKSPTLVLCRDGVTACGLYLALSFLLERMTVERECDVISAVRAVRRSRTEFVQSLDQFEYLYDAAVNYFECFQTYSNFS